MGGHWRVLVVAGNQELYHDSALSRESGYRMAGRFLAGVRP